MLDKTQLTKVAVAGFGAAMASVYAIPEAHATIVPINFHPKSVGYGVMQRERISTASGQILEFGQMNRSFAKEMIAESGTTFALASVGGLLSPATFNGAPIYMAPPSATGVGYLGFKSSAGNMGWFEVAWGGFHGAIAYLRGAYANAGESIIVGQMSASVPASVPEPSELGLFALGLLALGAAGVRMRREARKAAELN